MVKFKSRRGQGWTIDYIFSLLMFTVTVIIAVKLLTNFLPDTGFQEVEREAIDVSEQLLSKGYPKKWNNLDVIRIGVVTNKNRLSQAKIDNYLSLNYSKTRGLLGVSGDYAFYFQKNNSIVSLGEECALGSEEVLEVKNLYNEIRPSAYYYKDDSFMLGQMTALQSDVYYAFNDNEVNSFYDNIEGYSFVMMENPEINTGGSLTTVQKIEKLEDFVDNGGVLFLSGNVSIDLTSVIFSTTIENHGTVVEDQDPYMDITIGRDITDNNLVDPSFIVIDQASSGFTTLAEYQNTAENWIARWGYGLGNVYYFATIDALYSSGGGPVALNNEVGEGANNVVNRTRANCSSISFTGIETDNIAKIDRLVVYNSTILNMVVVAWS